MEDGQGPVPGLEGSEAAEGADPAADGAVEALKKVVAHRDQPSSMADRRALELGDDVSRPRHDLRYGRRIGRGPVGDEDVRCEARLGPRLPQRPGRGVPVPPLRQLHGYDVPPVVLHDVDVGLPTSEPDVELVDMPYPGVLRPVPALELVEAAVEPAGPEEDGVLGEGVAHLRHEVRGFPAGEPVGESEAEGEDHLLRGVFHAGEEGSAPLVELPAAVPAEEAL